MTYSKRASILSTVSGAIASLVLLSTGAIASSVTTESRQNPFHPNPEPLVSQASNGGFDGQGRPQSRSSGGARGSCSDQLIALLPGPTPISNTTNSCSLPSEADATQTITATPTLWFYVPARQQSVQAELVLLDQNQQAISIETMTLAPTAGIVGVQIRHPLAVNRSYQWVFSLLETNSPSLNRSVEGTIRRVELAPPLVQQLTAESTLRERITLLAQQGIWQDALTEIIVMRQTAPHDATVRQDWQQFVESVGLSVIVNAPVLN
ncbi:MAG: DUF928 domain-containing protein [Leptolyngbya sp. IPPAS B-1204]|nr:DUF928 domain-containing protein [Elainella sp. C42_A2020_010]